MIDKTPRLLGLAQLSLLNTAPPQLVGIAAEAGFDFIGVRVRPVTPSERPYDLQPGSPMLRDTLDRMQDTGVTVRDIEFLLMDGSEQREAWLRMMEAGQALGAGSLTVAAADPDTARLMHNLAQMAEDGRSFGITPTLEAISYQAVASIAQAADIARRTGCRIVVDTLHFNRFDGGGKDDAGKADQWTQLRTNAALVPLVQLCDGPARRPVNRDELVLESRSERGVPGEGDFDLAGVVRALPDGLPVSAEVPSDRRVAEFGELAWARRLKAAVESVLAAASTLRATATPERTEGK